MTRTYFIYRHIRLDTNQVFYIGIGTVISDNLTRMTGDTFRARHRRAFERVKSRSKHWKAVASKTEILVEVMMHSDSVEFVKEKEIEFISLYRPTLCNQTNGGDGVEGFSHTKDAKEKISNSFKGRKLSQNHLRKINVAKHVAIDMSRGIESATINSALYVAFLFAKNKGFVDNSLRRGTLRDGWSLKYHSNQNRRVRR